MFFIALSFSDMLFFGVIMSVHVTKYHKNCYVIAKYVFFLNNNNIEINT